MTVKKHKHAHTTTVKRHKHVLKKPVAPTSALSCAPTHPENEDIKQHCRHATLPLLIL